MDWAKRLAYLGLGAASLTKEKIEAAIKELVERGEVTQEESRTLMAELVERGRRQKEEISGFVAKELQRLASELPFAPKSEVAALRSRIEALERRLGDSSDEPGREDAQ